MIEALSVAIIFAITEVFKYVIAIIEKKIGRMLTKEVKGYIVLIFAFAISLLYSIVVITQIIDQTTIDTTLRIFAGAIALYEVLYKRILTKIIETLNTK